MIRKKSPNFLKSSLIGEKSPNLVTLFTMLSLLKEILTLLFECSFVLNDNFETFELANIFTLDLP